MNITQKEDRLVTVLCPAGHTLWKSIKLTTMWKKYGVRFNNKQCVVEGYDYSRMKNFMLSQGITSDQLKTTSLDARNKDRLTLPIYQLNTQQTKWCSRKCKECNPESKPM